MRRMRKLPAGVVATTVCLVNIGSSGDPAPTERSAVCAARPQGQGGLPSALAQWAEGARPFAELGNFHRQVTTGPRPSIGLTATWDGQTDPVVLAEVREH